MRSATITPQAQTSSKVVAPASSAPVSSSSSTSPPPTEDVCCDAPPTCAHNCWTRSRRRRTLPGVRLRCLVCGGTWVTKLESHKKCPGFYCGKCPGDCGLPHIHARGTIPKGLPVGHKAEILNMRSLKDLVVAPATKGRRAKMVSTIPGSALAVALEACTEEEEEKGKEAGAARQGACSTSDRSSVSEETSEGGHVSSAGSQGQRSAASGCDSVGSSLAFRHDPYSTTSSMVCVDP